jgi:hypothetical protein
LTSELVRSEDVSFKPRPIYPRGKGPRYQLARRLGGPHNWSGRRGYPIIRKVKIERAEKKDTWQDKKKDNKRENEEKWGRDRRRKKKNEQRKTN